MNSAELSQQYLTLHPDRVVAWSDPAPWTPTKIGLHVRVLHHNAKPCILHPVHGVDPALLDSPLCTDHSHTQKPTTSRTLCMPLQGRAPEQHMQLKVLLRPAHSLAGRPASQPPEASKAGSTLTADDSIIDGQAACCGGQVAGHVTYCQSAGHAACTAHCVQLPTCCSKGKESRQRAERSSQRA